MANQETGEQKDLMKEKIADEKHEKIRTRMNKLKNYLKNQVNK